MGRSRSDQGQLREDEREVSAFQMPCSSEVRLEVRCPIISGNQRIYESARDPRQHSFGSTTSRFKAGPHNFADAIVYCRQQSNASLREVLIVGSRLYHDLVTALARDTGCCVVWTSRDRAVTRSRQVKSAYENWPCAVFSTLLGFAE